MHVQAHVKMLAKKTCCAAERRTEAAEWELLPPRIHGVGGAGRAYTTASGAEVAADPFQEIGRLIGFQRPDLHRLSALQRGDVAAHPWCRDHSVASLLAALR